jgi:class 3 adenylate cyclase
MGKTLDAREAGRKALERHAWGEALDLLKQAEAAGELDAEGLENLADAAWWMAQPADAIAARERAFSAYVAAGNTRRAAGVALRLTQLNANKLAFAAAQAWFSRAQQLVEDDQDSVEFGYMLFTGFLLGPATPDLAETIALGQRIADIGKRHNDRELQAMASIAQGSALIAHGDIAAGFAYFDAATVAAVAGELDIWSTGWVYCTTIGTCRELADYRRASEWTEATTRWCERQSITGFPGICRVYRAEIVALRGAWAQAEQEARRACEELQRYDLGMSAGLAFYDIGEIRMRMGDLPAAKEAFRRAHEMGMVPEPGMSLLRLAEGDAANAGSSLHRALANETVKFTRARLLPAEIEVALALGDRDRARTASTELDEIAKRFGTPAMEAIASSSRGMLQLADGDAVAAEGTLRAVLRLWLELGVPYEVARTRLLLAEAYRAQGDGPAATLELEAAYSTFERLGARRDLRRTAELLGGEAPALADDAGLETVERTFLFTDVVLSTKLAAAIGDDAWKDLIRWHDQTLRALIAEHRGEEIRHTGDGFFVAFASPSDAIDCAVTIQRRLNEQRKQQGFALQVRIGMHTSAAHRRGLDYAGFGVHEAARIAAAAGAGEIFASAGTLAAAKMTYPSAMRSLTLKDMPEPVEVAAIEWR